MSEAAPPAGGLPSDSAVTALADLLRVEDDPAFIEQTCDATGIPLWTAVRQPVLRLVGASRLYSTALVNGEYRLGSDVRRKALAFAKAVDHNHRHLPVLEGTGQITISASGAGLLPGPAGLFNRLADYFASARPDHTVVIEDLFDWRWPFPRANPRVLFRAPIQAEMAIRGRLFERRTYRRAADFIARVDQRLREAGIGGLPVADRGWLTAMLARWLHTAPHEVARYQRLFDRLGTRVLLKEEGCYGHAAPMIVAAKAVGAVTAEYQHGVVNRNHDSYNFATAVHRSRTYRHTLPRFFLSYGRWWEAQMNVPFEAVPVGSPHRSESLGRWAAGERTDILVLGEGFDRDFYLDFCRRLAAGAPSGRRVIFRPHPLERQHFADPAYRSRWAGVEIDDEKDVYRSLTTCAALVGEMSTVLFEAIGLVDRIFLFDTAKAAFSLPVHPFEKFADADDLLARMMREPDVARPEPESYWASNWRRRYDAFLSPLGAPPSRPGE